MTPLIFIIGNSRSGTTLLARILNQHPSIYILNETHFMEELSKEQKNFHELDKNLLPVLTNKLITIQRKGYYRKSQYQEYPQDTNEIIKNYMATNEYSFASLMVSFFKHEANLQGKIIAGDQTPRHIYYINELHELFPTAKFIHIVRDPRAVLLSQKNKWKATIAAKQPWFESIRTRINYHPLTMSILWNKGVQATEHKAASIRVYTVIFEELTSQPGKTIRDLCNYLNVDSYKNMLNVNVSLSSNISKMEKKGINGSVAERWKQKLSRTEIFIAERVSKSFMRKYGYKLTGAKVNIFHILFFIIYFPVHLSSAFLFNITRMGNPVSFFKKRITPD